MTADIREIELQEQLQKLKSSSNWFYWIAGLSLVNMLVIIGGANFHFVIGSSFVDFCSGIGQGGFIGGYIFAVLIIGGFAFLGHIAAKGNKWPFILGMVIYGADGLLYLTVGDFMSTLFHAFVLFKFYQGIGLVQPYLQLKQNLEEEPLSVQTIEVQQVGSSSLPIETAAIPGAEAPLNPEA